MQASLDSNPPPFSSSEALLMCLKYLKTKRKTLIIDNYKYNTFQVSPYKYVHLLNTVKALLLNMETSSQE